jgi:hypothetical protein
LGGPLVQELQALLTPLQRQTLFAILVVISFAPTQRIMQKKSLQKLRRQIDPKDIEDFVVDTESLKPVAALYEVW